MPYGVICGGAVEGSNQAGEIVTCQAITTRPAGAGSAARAALAPKSESRNHDERTHQLPDAKRKS